MGEMADYWKVVADEKRLKKLITVKLAADSVISWADGMFPGTIGGDVLRSIEKDGGGHESRADVIVTLRKALESFEAFEGEK